MGELQVNLVVSDLDASKAFYESLGLAFREVTTPADPEPVAWIATDGLFPVALHSPGFARWWEHPAPDPASAGADAVSAGAARPGAAVIDVSIEDRAAAVALLQAAADSVVKPLSPMPWGESYAMLADPDGYLWGIKTPI